MSMTWRRHSCLPRPHSWGRSWFDTVPAPRRRYADTPFAGESACATTSESYAGIGGAGFSLPTPACGRIFHSF